MSKKDTIFAKRSWKPGDFTFNKEVASVFTDMLIRSIPNYLENLDFLTAIAKEYWQPETSIYDLGCSQGNLTYRVASALKEQSPHIVALDASPDMITAFHDNASSHSPSIEALCTTIQEASFTKTSVVFVNYVLQFISPEERLPILKKIYDALVPGGILLMGEKVCFADAKLQAIEQEYYFQFKRNNGYSDTEIYQKREALENVLIPDTIEQHMQRCKDAGFTLTEIWFKRFNFCSFICTKE
ncbi:MAG: carboxy-S-adenosyl-L-methionine synthase CmoA [Fibrobacterales bacterium]